MEEISPITKKKIKIRTEGFILQKPNPTGPECDGPDDSGNGGGAYEYGTPFRGVLVTSAHGPEAVSDWHGRFMKHDDFEVQSLCSTHLSTR